MAEKLWAGRGELTDGLDEVLADLLGLGPGGRAGGRLEILGNRVIVDGRVACYVDGLNLALGILCDRAGLDRAECDCLYELLNARRRLAPSALDEWPGEVAPRSADRNRLPSPSRATS